MNEVVVNSVLPERDTVRPRTARPARRSSAFYGYAATILALAVGWLFKDMRLITPKFGVGYWLGIVGGTMMLLLLLYPLRKRVKVFRVLGGTAQWFRLHMILGVLGPLLVLYHSNFQLGSFNSRVALFCMLLVAGSGVVGRHIYARIHRGLYGGKTNLKELREDLAESLAQNRGLVTLLPEFAEKLRSLAASVEGDRITGSLSTGASLKWTFRKYTVWWALRNAAKQELRRRAEASPALAQDYRRLMRASSSYVRKFVRLTSRVAQFSLYERMFSIWHVLHLPLFFMMIISALLHVLAVHMY